MVNFRTSSDFRSGNAAIHLPFAGWLLSVISLLAASPVLGQSASQITPQDFRPEATGSSSVFIPDMADMPPEAGVRVTDQDQLRVVLGGLIVEGALPQLAAVTDDFRSSLIGREVGGAEIMAAARTLEAAYARAGYLLLRVVLPPQELTDGGTLRLQLVDGVIEKLDVSGLPSRVRNHIAGLLAPLVGRQHLTLAEVERRILLAGDVPGVVLRSTLAPGQHAGGTILVVEAKHQPISALLTVDNHLSDALGRPGVMLGADINSVAGLGEQFYVRLSGYPGAGFPGADARNRMIAGGAILPIGRDGTSLSGEYVTADTRIGLAGGVHSEGRFRRFSLRLRHMWVRVRHASFGTELALDIQDERQALSSGSATLELSHDRTRVLRIGGNGSYLVSWGGAFAADMTMSLGLPALGARRRSDVAGSLVPLSRQGADADFRKFDLGLSYKQPLASHLTISGSGQLQTSFGKPLLRGEQMGLVSSRGLSGFDAGSVVADSGIALRGELQSPWQIRAGRHGIGASLAPYGFASYGSGRLHQPTAVERRQTSAHALGAGVRFVAARPGTQSGLSASLEYARANKDGQRPESRVTMAVALRF